MVDRIAYKDNCGRHLRTECEQVDTVEIVGRYEDTGLESGEIPTEIELANAYAVALKLKQYEALGIVERLTELYKAESEGRDKRKPHTVGGEWFIKILLGLLCYPVPSLPAF